MWLTMSEYMKPFALKVALYLWIYAGSGCSVTRIAKALKVPEIDVKIALAWLEDHDYVHGEWAPSVAQPGGVRLHTWIATAAIEGCWEDLAPHVPIPEKITKQEMMK